MNINIKIISRNKMRKEVDGADWFFDKKGNLQVRICPMSNWRMETLLAIHETIEAILCKYNKVSVKKVDKFDQEYDKNHPYDLEAGDDSKAPYVREHCFATAVERILCAEMKVNWHAYDKELEKTYPGASKRNGNKKNKRH